MNSVCSIVFYRIYYYDILPSRFHVNPPQIAIIMYIVTPDCGNACLVEIYPSVIRVDIIVLYVISQGMVGIYSVKTVSNGVISNCIVVGV